MKKIMLIAVFLIAVFFNGNAQVLSLSDFYHLNAMVITDHSYSTISVDTFGENRLVILVKSPERHETDEGEWYQYLHIWEEPWGGIGGYHWGFFLRHGEALPEPERLDMAAYFAIEVAEEPPASIIVDGIKTSVYKTTYEGPFEPEPAPVYFWFIMF